MIFPGEFKDFSVKPSLKLSWVVLFLNVIIFAVMSLVFESWPSYKIRQQLNDEHFINAVYQMYLQSIDPVEKKNLNGGVAAVYSRALKDQKFWSRISDYPFAGDQVEIKATRAVIQDFYKSYLQSAQYQYGLGSFEASPWSWLTYQFVHASLIHLISNMMIVFLIISYLEKTMSSHWIAAIYLLSGFAGGAAFLFFDNVGSLSVIGASASATGLLSFLLISQCGQLMPWYFLIAPLKKGYGKIYLPVFFIFPIFLVSDFVSLLWEPNGVAANVAVSAHVGGAFMGFLLGGLYLFLGSKSAAHRVFSDNDGFHELS